MPLDGSETDQGATLVFVKSPFLSPFDRCFGLETKLDHIVHTKANFNTKPVLKKCLTLEYLLLLSYRNKNMMLSSRINFFVSFFPHL